MRNIRNFSVPALLLTVAAFMFMGLNTPENEDKKPDMPDNIKAIVDKSCMGCHNSDSKSEKAKNKLNFTTFNELSDVKKIKTLREIVEVLDENKMPPEKFLKMHPEKGLTEKEELQLKEWAQKEAKAVLSN
ncbi:heme-binding domain-containing protein [Saccharicrinis sp. FJH54]|uniref:heme-binding domain-containing protein n=1 Tax=Saccharicrinis sp. FJH54 TaxID=3344665 RepID=UPI0035D514C5